MDAPFTIKSTAFKEGQMVPKKNTCDGDNINPMIELVNLPEGTETLALIFEDIDSTKDGGIWTHWILWNIDRQTHYIPEDSVPLGAVLGKNSFGRARYDGPCPLSGSGPHRYRFRAFALDATLEIPEDSGREELERAMEGHVLAEASLTGIYERK